MTYACSLTLSRPRTSIFKEGAYILGASLFLALSAQIAIPVSWSPVPFSMQTLAVLLIGVFLGSKRGALAIIAYLVEGAMGLPVLAGGYSGFWTLLGTTGGYLLGFIPAAFLAGYFAERQRTNGLNLYLAHSVILLLGFSWLSLFIGAGPAFKFGVLPFIIGDFFKIFIVLKASRYGHSFIQR